MCYTCACNKYYNSTLQRQAHAYGMHEINNNMVQSLFRYYYIIFRYYYIVILKKNTMIKLC